MLLSALILFLCICELNRIAHCAPSQPYHRQVVERRHQIGSNAGSTIHFSDDSTSSTLSHGLATDSHNGDDNYEKAYQHPRQKNYVSPLSQSWDSASSWNSAVYPDESTAIINFARGSNENDSFRVRSSEKLWSTKQSFNADNESVTSMSRSCRAKRSTTSVQRQAYGPKHYYYPPPPTYHSTYENEEEDCQYHTLVNGDSDILLRKILPIRLRGRTLVRTCIPKIPAPNDPRYKVLLRGNNQSSFGHLSVSMKG